MTGRQVIMLTFLTGVVAYLASRNPQVRQFAERVAQKISNGGVNLIKQWEGFEEIPYTDIAGHKTVGSGIKLYPGHPLYNVSRITEQQGDALLREHVAREVDPTITRYVKVPLTQNQYDALASFIYNLGPGNFKKSTILRRLNALDYKGAADAFMMWNKARVGGVLKEVQGLTNRRNAERALFLS